MHRCEFHIIIISDRITKTMAFLFNFRKMTSSIRQNFHKDCEEAINNQINLEMHASYTYLALYAHFLQYDKALHGFSKMFLKSSQEEKDHGRKVTRRE